MSGEHGRITDEAPEEFRGLTVAEAQAQIVARLDAGSAAKEGAPLKLWADSRSIHVFDPATGENLGLTRR